jgi:hypothetical protein
MYTFICALHSYCVLYKSHYTATGLTILGPLLFILYSNYLPHKINNISKPILFAKNTSIIFSNSDTTDYVTEFIVTFDKINVCFTINSLTLNKTNYVHFTAKTNTKIHINLNFENIQINNINNKKFLGLTI